VTPTEHAVRMDQIFRYIGRLLTAPDGSTEWHVGRMLLALPASRRLAFVDSLIDDHPETTRAYEIGWDLWAIARGLPESEAAA
jgi:hypothetical protein